MLEQDKVIPAKKKKKKEIYPMNSVEVLIGLCCTNIYM